MTISYNKNGATSDSQATVAVHFVRLLTDYYERHGFSTDDLFAGHGVTPIKMNKPDDRLSFSLYDKLLERVATDLRDDHLGLKLGEEARFAHIGINGVLFQACRDGWEALPRIIKYSDLTTNAFRNEIEVDGDEVTLTCVCQLPEGLRIGRHHQELNFSFSRTLAEQLTGARASLTGISFRHCAPEDPSIAERHFGCPIEYGAAVDSLSFNASFLDHPINFGIDSASLRILDELCDRYLQSLQGKQAPQWLHAARVAIVDELPNGDFSLEQIAGKIGMPVRRFQRMLRKNELNFRQLVDVIRQELAQEYLTSTDISLMEIAIRLGFSEQSGFQRAYRRWFGVSPGQARASAS